MTSPTDPLAESRGAALAEPRADALAELRAQLQEVTGERDALRAQLDGDLPKATRWLQRKVWRQAAALDTLNRRVVTQRFVLRTLDGLGRSLSVEEYRAARARIANAQLRERVDEPAVA
jgi:hypothetical protein